GVVRSSIQFRWIARVRGESGKLKAGEYLFDAPLTPSQVLDRVVRGDIILHRLTIPEGLTAKETLERIARSRLAKAADLETAFRDPSPIRSLDPLASDLEGYLFPETYHFAKGTPAAKILEEMTARFREVFDGTRIARAAELGMTPRQAVT